MEQLKKLDRSVFTEEQRIQFQFMDDRTVRLFSDSPWPQFAMDYAEEVGGTDATLPLVMVYSPYDFFTELIGIANKVWNDYINSQTEIEMKNHGGHENLPADFQLTLNTIELEARELAQEEIKKYVHEKLIV